jgi:phage antirepressor YoqD-like protein
MENKKTGSRNQHTTEQIKALFIETYQKNLCNVSKTCKTLKVGRTQYYTWMKDDAFKEAIESSEIYQLEFVEDALLKKIKEGSDSSIQFYLKTKGKKYGYGIQTDITTNGESLNITIIRLVEKNKEEDDKSKD